MLLVEFSFGFIRLATPPTRSNSFSVRVRLDSLVARLVCKRFKASVV